MNDKYNYRNIISLSRTEPCKRVIYTIGGAPNIVTPAPQKSVSSVRVTGVVPL